LNGRVFLLSKQQTSFPTDRHLESIMDIKNLLSLADVLLDVSASDKARLLQKLADRAAIAVHLAADQIFRALSAREELGSTGTGSGIAIPHARLEGLKKPFGILARLKRPVAFDAIDGKPVDIVFLLLLPTAPAGEQLNALAAVARKLRNPQPVRDLRAATDCAGLFRAMTMAERVD
jgi:nitrogen PTS system EIIA component